VTSEDVVAATGWDVRFIDDLGRTEPPTARELEVLRDLHSRTDAAHSAG